MTDYEYILQQARKFHYKGWDYEELWKCVDMLGNLDRQELVLLYTSKWLVNSTIKEEIFKILYVVKLGKREECIKKMSITELISEFEEKKSSIVALVRQELKYRYIENFGEDRILIAEVFKNSRSKLDQKWIERWESYGKSEK